MRSGTFTYHSGYNYGASLQAYALQTIITRECGSNKIINFEPLDFLHSREMITKHPKRLKDIIKIITRLRYAKTLKRRQELFDLFTNEQLNVTEICRTREEAIKLAREFDCLVCGSDQIWNLGAPGDEFAPNMLYFLDFPKEQRRVSYAASFGKWVEQADSRKDEFLPWIEQFDAISVREQSGFDFLKANGINSRIDIDPTLLLGADDYRLIAQQPAAIPEKYVLLFSWATTSNVVRVAKQASSYYGLPAINIVPPPRAMFCGIKRKLDVGPREFLWLIDHADFVVTNSFHGTVFSSIFGKNYVSVYDTKPDPRMESILNFLGLSNRLRTEQEINENYFSGLAASDYDAVSEKLVELRADSIEYIRQNVK